MIPERTPVCAVIVAAGRGSRMGSGERKQFLDIAGEPMLARTLKVFQAAEAVDAIVLVTAPEDTDRCRVDIVERYGITKVTAVTGGGEARQDSVRSGIAAADRKYGILMIHDGARPFVTAAQIAECARAAEEYGASCLAAPVSDTIKISPDGHFFGGETDREKLWAVQTPQTFRRDLIEKAYEEAARDGFTATDDTALVSRMGAAVRIVKGGSANFKVTTPEDLELARAFGAARVKQQQH